MNDNNQLFNVKVLQYDIETCLYVCGRSETFNCDFNQAKTESKRMWSELENGQPKQIFIQNMELGRNVFYYDNFDKLNFKNGTNEQPINS